MYQLPANVDLGFLHNLELIQVCVGRSQVILRFEDDANISLECPFDLNGKRAGASELLELISLRITAANAIQPSRVTLTFSNGWTLAFEDVHQEFESYQISGPGELIIV